MFILDMTNPVTLVLLLAASVLLIYLGREIKRPVAPALALVFFLVLVVIHSVQLATISGANYELYRSTLIGSISIDLVMILITFFGYLWIDDIACKFYKKKNIDNCLEAFWKEV